MRTTFNSIFLSYCTTTKLTFKTKTLALIFLIFLTFAILLSLISQNWYFLRGSVCPSLLTNYEYDFDRQISLNNSQILDPLLHSLNHIKCIVRSNFKRIPHINSSHCEYLHVNRDFKIFKNKIYERECKQFNTKCQQQDFIFLIEKLGKKG